MIKSSRLIISLLASSIMNAFIMAIYAGGTAMTVVFIVSGVVVYFASLPAIDEEA